MTLKSKGILFGLSFILAGSILCYYQGYKNSRFIGYTYLGCIFIGWMISLFSIFGQRLLNDKRIKFKWNKVAWIEDKLTKAIIYLSLGFLILGNIELVNKLGLNRISSILNNNPTDTTTAVVTKIESRNTRGGAKLWAIISYVTPGKTVEQSVYDYQNRYSVGQKYLVKYAVGHPEMFEIIQQVK